MNEQQIKDIAYASEILSARGHNRLGARLLQYSEALAQPAQEPFGWYDGMGFSTNKNDFGKAISTAIPLYTNPAPSWQGLSDDEVDDIWFEVVKENNFEGTGKYFWRAIERALRTKNE